MKDNQTYREDEGSATDISTSGHTRQQSQVDSPAEGGDGYVGSNTGPKMGIEVVSGKKGSVTDKPVWSTQSSMMGVQDNSGSEDGDESNAGSDSTDEKASYKKVQTDEGLPQTWRTSSGAGDAGPADQVDVPSTQGNPDTQGLGEGEASEMPQTEFTENEGGGAPLFKHAK